MKPFPQALEDILTRRKAEGLTLQEIGRRANIDHSYIVKMRQGDKPIPPRSTLVSLSYALGVEPEYFTEYRQMALIVRGLAGEKEPTDRHWAVARMQVLLDRAEG